MKPKPGGQSFFGEEATALMEGEGEKKGKQITFKQREREKTFSSSLHVCDSLKHSKMKKEELRVGIGPVFENSTATGRPLNKATGRTFKSEPIMRRLTLVVS